jgi:hypothetical protein
MNKNQDPDVGIKEKPEIIRELEFLESSIIKNNELSSILNDRLITLTSEVALEKCSTKDDNLSCDHSETLRNFRRKIELSNDILISIIDRLQI